MNSSTFEIFFSSPKPFLVIEFYSLICVVGYNLQENISTQIIISGTAQNFRWSTKRWQVQAFDIQEVQVT